MVPAMPFLSKARNNEQASIRLFCFPYAGGSEFLFRTWAQSLPPTIEVCPVLLPGRGHRFREPPFTRMEPLVESLGAALRPYLARPYALFGHSMGALISFELARTLRRQGAPQPVTLFAAGHGAPQLPRRQPPIHELPENEFIAQIQQYGGIPQEALENAELMQVMAPLLRADFAVCHTYRYNPEPPLSCRIAALGGLEDVAFGRAEMLAWQEQTTQPLACHFFPGDHFFLREQELALTRTIASHLAEPVSIVGRQGIR